MLAEARRGNRLVACAGVLLLALAAGCQQAALRQAQQASEQRLAMESGQRELQQRMAELDAENNRLNELLAQAQRQTTLLAEQSDAYRDQLADALAQAAELSGEKQHVERRAETLQASLRRRGGATIEPNNSLREELPAIDLPGVQVVRDGEDVRVEIPASRLFVGDEAQLQPQAAEMLRTIAAELAARYPNRRIGVESHTDSGPIQSTRWASAHQLSVARAMTVFEQLAHGTGLRAAQLSIVGHGPARPAYSNGAEAGRERNRRIELVVYPETAP